MPIVKIKTYKKPKFEYLLRYMCESQDRLFDAHGKSFTITHNIRGKTIADWVKAFKENETYRLRKRKNSVYLNHEIISFHRDDTRHLSMEKLQQLVYEYIQLRNPNGCYVAVPHFDRYHVHVHICSSAVQYRSGKSMRMSREELGMLKRNIQDYQVERFPELARSVVGHGRKTDGKTSEKEQQLIMRTGKVSKRKMVRQVVQDCQQRSSSQEEFFEQLKEKGVETYTRGGKVYGVEYTDRKYRFNTLGLDVEEFQSRTKRHEKGLQSTRRGKGKSKMKDR